MKVRAKGWAVIAATTVSMTPGVAAAQDVKELQRQIDELRTQVKELAEALKNARQPVGIAATAAPPAPSVPAVVATTAPSSAPVLASVQGRPSVKGKPWYERFRLRGYTQLRYNAILDDRDAPGPDGSRLRSVHDSSINDDGGFLIRRARLVLQGDISDRLSLYLQHDFGSAVNNQSSTERRENFGQLRDAYVDVALTDDHSLKLRFGQSKVPFGWENLQSSSNRITVDRSDGINSGVPGERDVGVVAYYTPPQVQAIWTRLEKRGQKLFGNYGAFALALYNGQGTNRTERNDSLMKVAMATWPFDLSGVGLPGQVLEIGGSAYWNQYRPEVRTGGIASDSFVDRRTGIHAILYPQPIGVQAEWNWGRGPEYDVSLAAITDKKLNGGYVQVMYDAPDFGVGRVMPYGRWQRYRGGWKANVNAPPLETDELEIGVEWQAMDALELTLAFADMTRREADERRTGRAEGSLIRTQLQWNY